jgi:SAM-dependent methyltransferase
MTTRLVIAVRAPATTGTVRLEVDLVHEWVRWADRPAVQDVLVTTPYTEGFFEAHEEGSARSAEIVLPVVLELVRPRSVVDVGCGDGAWLAAATALGITDVLGIDGPWVEEGDLKIAPDRFRVQDLTQPFSLDRRFDLAMSLEVAEHLPADAAEAFVASLAGAAPLVLFSAAAPGQGGTAHLNEQWPAYWAALFARHGYEPVDALRAEIWERPGVQWWYAQNLLLFGAPEALEAADGLRAHPARGRAPLPLVHPARLG